MIMLSYCRDAVSRHAQGSFRFSHRTYANPLLSKEVQHSTRRDVAHLLSRSRDHEPDQYLISQRRLKELSQQEPTPMTLQQMRIAANPADLTARLNVTKFLHNELSIRYAKCAEDLASLPLGLSDMPSVRYVRHMYIDFLHQLENAKPPQSQEEDERYTAMLAVMKSRGSSIVPSISKGIRELKRSQFLSPTVFSNMEIQKDITKALDEFFLRRIGIRMLIGQYSEGKTIYGGRVVRLNPKEIAQNAAESAGQLCREIYGVSPSVEVIFTGDERQPFIYVASHLHHILFELIKNSMRAVVELPAVKRNETYSRNRKILPRQMDVTSPNLGFIIPDEIPDNVQVFPPYEYVEGDAHPSIRVVISQGTEDLCVKVSDQGGGVPRSEWRKLFHYGHTTAKPPNDESVDETFRDHFAGGGYGLPIARLFARYFGGELTLISMEGYGTDAYIQLHRLGQNYELVPGAAQRNVQPLAY